MHGQGTHGRRMAFYQRVLFYSLIGAWLLTMFTIYRGTIRSSADVRHPAPPFGIEWEESEQAYSYRDFPLMMTFCRQIWHRQVERPYSLAGQKQIFQNWMPGLQRGMPVAYSPTVLLWSWPLNFVSPATGYGLMSVINLVVMLLLLRRFLFPRAASLGHLFLMAIPLFSVSFLCCLRMAHNPILSCGLIALTWSLLYDSSRQRELAVGFGTEFLLALILFGLSAKPHVAFVLGTVLLAARLWRPVLVATVAFVVAAWCFSPMLGGWPVWVQDYVALMGGYHEKGMGSFLYFGPEVSTNFAACLVQLTSLSSEFLSRLSLFIWLGATAWLLVARWRGRLGLRDFFLLQYANFFLFSPSLAASEDWVLILLVAEAPFFRKGGTAFAWGMKAALLFAAVNLEQLSGTALATLPIPFIAKALLAVFALVGTLRHSDT